MGNKKNNLERMFEVIESTFATRSDPGQLQVTEKQMAKLVALHPATLSEVADEHGPLIWVLLIPTTENTMHEFLSEKITEKQLLEKTSNGESYNALYLCSATTLPEYRGKGETKKLCLKAISAIRKDHPIKTLFVWPFSEGGNALAQGIATTCGLPLLTRK